MSEALAVPVVDAERVALARMVDPPDAVIEEGRKAAAALQKVIAQKPKKVVFNDEQYLEFEDWQTLGRFYGVTVGLETEPELVDIGGTKGFKATAVAMLHGRVISRATAYCLNDEEKWGKRTKYEWAYVKKSGGFSVEDPGKDELIWEDNPKVAGKKRPKKERVKVGEEAVPLFQLASMAQTRACAKALRNVLSWVAVLAGYKPTPAEEMPGATTEPQREAGQDEEAPASTAICPHCKSPDLGTTPDGHAYCKKCRKGL